MQVRAIYCNVWDPYMGSEPNCSERVRPLLPWEEQSPYTHPRSYTHLCSLQHTQQHIVHKHIVAAATCDLSAADTSPSPATQACESRRYGTGLQPVAPAWAIPSYHSTPRAMHTPAHVGASPTHLHASPSTRPDSAQVSQHMPD